MTTKPVEFPDGDNSDSEREDNVSSPADDDRPQPIIKTYKVPNENDKSASKSSREYMSKLKAQSKDSKRVSSSSFSNSKADFGCPHSDEKATVPTNLSIMSPARPKLAQKG